MASDEGGEKTEPASQRRRTEARESGQMAKSQELTAAVLLCSGLALIYITGPGIVRQLAMAMRQLLGGGSWGTERELVDASIRMGGQPLVRILAPVFLVMFIAAFLINLAQAGLVLSWKSVTPDLKKLNPIGGLGRLFAKQNLFQLLMNLLKMTVVSIVAAQRFKHNLPLILSLGSIEFPRNMGVAMSIVYDLGLRVAIALLILAILDWAFQKYKFEHDIKMSKQEVKDELKMMEGDMQTKAKRRQFGRKLVMQRIRADVPRADVVVTNPTHLAVAIKYDPATMRAPRVVAKGADHLALMIRQVALQHGVPLVEKKPLAQALYASVEVGHEVPPELYQAIAEILAYVYELSGKEIRRRKSA